MTRVKRWTRRIGGGGVGFAVAYLLLLAFPQPLFAYQLHHAGITVHANEPIPDAMRATLEKVRARLDRTPLYDPAFETDVFICSRPMFALFARNNYQVGGIANVYFGGNVFLRESDLSNDRLIGPSGKPVAADRPLSYFIAHEIMHVVHLRRFGRWGYYQLPRWLDDGHADFVARDIDLPAALRGFKSGARELDPTKSGLYLRYHLMVAYLLERKGLTVETLFAAPLTQDQIERELLSLSGW